MAARRSSLCQFISVLPTIEDDHLVERAAKLGRFATGRSKKVEENKLSRLLSTCPAVIDLRDPWTQKW